MDLKKLRAIHEKMQNRLGTAVMEKKGFENLKLMYILIPSDGTLPWIPGFVNMFGAGRIYKILGSFMFF